MRNEINSIFSLPTSTEIGQKIAQFAANTSFIISADDLIAMKDFLSSTGTLTDELLTKEVVMCLKINHYYTFIKKDNQIKPLVRNKSAYGIHFKNGDPRVALGRIDKYEPAEETVRVALGEFLCIEAIDNIIIHSQQALLHTERNGHEMLAMIFVVKDERVIEHIKASPDFVLLLEKEIYESDMDDVHKNAILDIIAEKW